MSQIPSGISRLKTPSKIVKPIQGGGVSGTSQTPTPYVKPRGATKSSDPSTGSTAQPRTSPLAASGLVRRGAQAAETASERLVSPRGSVTGTQIAQPRLPSRENSQTRLQYRRESSSSSLHGASSKKDSSQTTVRRRGEIPRAPESQASNSKSNLFNLFKIGDRVLVGSNPGVIAFVGETRFAKGDWAGVVLDDTVGKNNGSVQGVRYFECQPGHGIFTKLEKLTKINQIPGDSRRISVSESTDSKAESSLKIGARVVVSGSKHGVIRYLGETGFAKGKWAGVELDEPLGKNDGAVAGTR